LHWRQFYFPPVGATLDATESLSTTPAARTGLAEVSIPTGAHTLEMQPRSVTLAQQAGLALSVLGVALLAILLALSGRGRRWP
jgi:hypothetical protein